MQPTIRSQTRLKRSVWLLTLILAATVLGGGFYALRLSLEVEAVEAALDAAQRELSAARKAAETARAELESKLKAARGQAGNRLNPVTDKAE